MCQHCYEEGLYEADAKSAETNRLHAKLIGMQLMGVFFGYPVCCIQAFIKRAEGIQLAIATKDMKKVDEAAQVLPEQEGFHHGFIPCPECAKTVKPGEEGKLIQKTRVCSTPYPHDHTSDVEFDKFMEGALK